ncbi:MAG: glycerate kinase [Lewinellaceae bacterium]|nr:glycerate kinase [Lewinellaceae bacterium]
MKILIAADSFKDALPASKVCGGIEAGIRAARPDAAIRSCPLADGGEGTFEVLAAQLAMQTTFVTAQDPLSRPIVAKYGLHAPGRTAFIEMAETAGLQLLLPEERNPLRSTSFGVGQQIADALRRGARHIVLAIGGSATNDAGIGMAAALGWQFLDKNGLTLPPVGGSLSQITTIIPPANRPDAQVEVICDVTNPLFGPTGAAYIYARQKGADIAAIEQLDKGLRHFARVVTQTDSAPDPLLPGSGAAGGMGYGAMLFLNAELRRGIDLVLDLLDFEEKLAWADVVVTGEGKIDGQTAQGKLVQGLCRRAARHGKPVVALCGRLEATEKEIQEIGLLAAYSINDATEGAGLAEMLKNTSQNLEKKARHIFSNFSHGVDSLPF